MFSKGLLCDHYCAGYWGCNYKQDLCGVYVSAVKTDWNLCFKKPQTALWGQGSKQT